MESFILHIDTAGPRGLVAMSQSGRLLGFRESQKATEHAAFVQPAIRELSSDLGVALRQLTAVSVANGPGSYTGLRVGLAAAKGLCMVLGVPLITLNVLDLMAGSVSDQPGVLRCPMIDARRMEVFTALYAADGSQLMPPAAKLLEANSYSEWLEQGPVLFVGDGAGKWSSICNHSNAGFQEKCDTLEAHVTLAFTCLQQSRFADPIHADPFYLKPFYHPASS